MTTPDLVPGLLAAIVALGGDLAPAPGVTGSVGLVVTGTASGDVKVRIQMVDGRPVEASTDPGPEPELTLTLPAPEAGAIGAGTLDPSVAFMRGRLKTAGDNGLLLGLLAATAEPGFGSWLVRVSADPAPS
jgi:hypothetical protein